MAMCMFVILHFWTNIAKVIEFRAFFIFYNEKSFLQPPLPNSIEMVIEMGDRPSKRFNTLGHSDWNSFEMDDVTRGLTHLGHPHRDPLVSTT